MDTLTLLWVCSAALAVLASAAGCGWIAARAWRGKAQATVDNALMRYFILHAHKLLTPGDDEHH